MFETLLPLHKLPPQTEDSYQLQLMELHELQQAHTEEFIAQGLVERAMLGASTYVRQLRIRTGGDNAEWQSMAYRQAPHPERGIPDRIHIFGIAVRMTAGTEAGRREYQTRLAIGNIIPGRNGGIIPLHGKAAGYTISDTLVVYNALQGMAWAASHDIIPDLSADYTTIVRRTSETAD